VQVRTVGRVAGVKEDSKLCSTVVTVVFHFTLSGSVLSCIIIFTSPHWVWHLTVVWFGVIISYFFSYYLLLFFAHIHRSLPLSCPAKQVSAYASIDNELATCGVSGSNELSDGGDEKDEHESRPLPSTAEMHGAFHTVNSSFYMHIGECNGNTFQMERHCLPWNIRFQQSNYQLHFWDKKKWLEHRY
jgi:hypothetical protein